MTAVGVPDPAEVWWISDGPVDEGGKKILGPFESRDLALSVRRLYEDHADARGLTFWVSRDTAAEQRLADHNRTRDRELGERIAAAISRMPLTRITERPAMGGMVHTAYPAEVIRADAAAIARAESERARQHTGTGGE